MSITRLRQARQMYAMGQRVGRIAFGGGGTMGASDRGYQGGGQGGYGNAGPSNAGPSNDGPSNDGPSNDGPNIHTGPTYKAPPRVPDQIGPSTFGKVPGVDYSAVGPKSQYQENIALNNQLLNTPYQFKKMPYVPYISTPINFLGSTIGKFGYDKNTKFFSNNSIGGKINPETGEPFGYGIDGYKDYMKQRQLGNVGAYGNENMGQNAINERAGDGDGTQGIMDVYNNQDYGDEDGDGDVDQDDFIFKYFDKTGETLQAGAGGVQDLMSSIRERISNLFS